jgi:hypothetical protein
MENLRYDKRNTKVSSLKFYLTTIVIAHKLKKEKNTGPYGKCKAGCGDNI